MRVLEKGKPWSVSVRCTGRGNGGQGCESLLEAESDDMRYYPGADHPVVRPAAVSVRCPECRTITDLDRRDWPKGFNQLPRYTTAWAKTGE